MMSDENIKALGAIIQRYALTDRIGPVAIVAATDEAFRQAGVFAAAASNGRSRCSATRPRPCAR
jgi:hypothetical protein